MVRDTCHRGWRGFLVLMASGCQGDLKQASDEFSVFKEGFIEIADSTEEDGISVLFFTCL